MQRSGNQCNRQMQVRSNKHVTKQLVPRAYRSKLNRGTTHDAAKECSKPLNSQFALPNYSNTVVHDNDAPTKVGAIQTPSFVRIR